jgi:hypothetical protein
MCTRTGGARKMADASGLQNRTSPWSNLILMDLVVKTGMTENMPSHYCLEIGNINIAFV